MLGYYLVAGVVAALYLGILALLLLLPWHYMWAIALAQTITITIAFPTYRTLIFRSTEPIGRDFVRFLGVWMSGLVAGLVATPLLVEIFGLAPLLAQIIAIVVVSLLTFVAHRQFSFREGRKQQEES